MFQTSHLQELKRRYREMYLPKPEELDEHCGVCGEGGEHGIEEGKPSRKLAQRDVGMECQECGKKFRAKLSTLQYGKTKCPKCKSTDLDFAYGESVEVKEDTDKDEPGTQGDQAEYQKKRKEIAAKFGVKSCSELEGEKKKACYAALDAAHVSDDEEEDEDDDPVGKNEEVIPEGTALQVKMALDDVGLKGKWKNNKVYVKKRDVEKAKKALKGNVIYKGKPPVVVGEEIEIDEKRGSGYDLYHKTFSSAMQHAYAHAKKKGDIVAPKEMDDKVATGPKKPSSGKKNRYILGTNTRKKVHIQVANLDNKRYELNMYIENAFDYLGKVKNILERMKPEEVEEAPSPNQAAIDRYLKRGGKITKYTGPDKKKIKKDTDSLRSTLSKMGKKEREDAKKASRRYVQGGRDWVDTDRSSMLYNLPDYDIYRDPKKFPRSLISGLQKIVSGVKIGKYEIKHKKFGRIPGLGVTFPGDSAPKLMIQLGERIHDPDIPKIAADPKYDEPGVDPKTYRKFDVVVWINEAATAKDRKIDRVDWFQRKEFEGSTAEEAAKRTLQYLKTKVKRMAKEEVELESMTEEIRKLEERRKAYSNLIPFPDKVLIDFAKRAKKAGLDFDQYTKFVKGTFKDGADEGRAIIHGRDIFKDKEDGRKKLSGAEAKRDNIARRAALRKRLGLEQVVVEEVSAKEFDALKKGDTVTIEFKSPMSTGKVTFKVTAKNVVGKARIEKVTLKNVKRPSGVKFFLYKRGNKVSLAQGDMAASVVSFAKEEVVVEREMTPAEKAKREEIVLSLKKKEKEFKERYGDKWKEVMYATATKMAMGEQEEPKSKKKDKINLKPKMDERQMKSLKDFKKELEDQSPKPQNEETSIKEGVTEQGVEYGEQDWDLEMRPEALYPNLNVNFSEFMEQGLEGPYLWKGEHYFFDRKINGWFSMSSEDYVSDAEAEELHMAYNKHGLTKAQFSN